MSKMRNFKLIGGPYDGTEGEFVDTGQAATTFHGIFYNRAPIQPGKRVRFVYNAEVTETAVRAKGIDPSTGQRVVPLERPEHSIELKVEGLEWVARLDGEVLGTQPVSKLQSMGEAKEWLNGLLPPWLTAGKAKGSQ